MQLCVLLCAIEAQFCQLAQSKRLQKRVFVNRVVDKSQTTATVFFIFL